jgi:hypothetical protein
MDAADDIRRCGSLPPPPPLPKNCFPAPTSGSTDQLKASIASKGNQRKQTPKGDLSPVAHSLSTAAIMHTTHLATCSKNKHEAPTAQAQPETASRPHTAAFSSGGSALALTHVTWVNRLAVTLLGGVFLVCSHCPVRTTVRTQAASAWTCRQGTLENEPVTALWHANTTLPSCSRHPCQQPASQDSGYKDSLLSEAEAG